MITGARFQNFKALRDVTVDFPTPLTVFVGPNASGKSSVLQGISLVRRLLAKKPGSQISLASDYFCKSSDSDELRIELVDEHQAAKPVIAIGKNNWDGGFLSLEDVKPDAKPAPDERRRSPAPSSVQRFPIAEILRLDPALLSAASYSGDKAPTLAANGAGLPSVLAELATSDPARFMLIQEALRTVIPAVRQIRLLRASVEYQEAGRDPAGGRMLETRIGAGHKIYFDFKGADKVPAELTSEGTLLVLGWLTAVLGQEWQSLLLVDDLDRALHPQAQRELVDILRRLLSTRPMLQILATSHSPYLLDKLKAEEIRLMTLSDDGVALCGTLMQHPEYARWKDVMLPGELWSTAGDAWLRERRDG